MTDRYLDIIHQPGPADLGTWARENGYSIVGIDNVPGCTDLEASPLPQRSILVFGQAIQRNLPGTPRRVCRGQADPHVRLNQIHERCGGRRYRHALLVRFPPVREGAGLVAGVVPASATAPVQARVCEAGGSEPRLRQRHLCRGIFSLAFVGCGFLSG